MGHAANRLQLIIFARGVNQQHHIIAASPGIAYSSATPQPPVLSTRRRSCQSSSDDFV